MRTRRDPDLPESMWPTAPKMAQRYGGHGATEALRRDYHGVPGTAGVASDTMPPSVWWRSVQRHESIARLGRIAQITPRMRILVAIEAVKGGKDRLARPARQVDSGADHNG